MMDMYGKDWQRVVAYEKKEETVYSARTDENSSEREKNANNSVG